MRKHKLKMMVLLTSLALAGCAGLGESDKLESQAFRDYQKAGALVERKNIKLELASKAADKASEGVVEARKELAEAEAALKLAKEKLDAELNK